MSEFKSAILEPKKKKKKKQLGHYIRNPVGFLKVRLFVWCTKHGGISFLKPGLVLVPHFPAHPTFLYTSSMCFYKKQTWPEAALSS